MVGFAQLLTTAAAANRQALEALSDGRKHTLRTVHGAVTGVVDKVEGDTLVVRVAGPLNEQPGQSTQRVRLSDLTLAYRQSILGEKAPATPDEWLAEMLRSLAAKDIKQAAQALARASTHPLAARYLTTLPELRWENGMTSKRAVLSSSTRNSMNFIVLHLDEGVKLELVPIPAGEFMMGNPDPKLQRGEGPPHPVKISQSFYMGQYEVTQAQYQAVVGCNPSEFKGHPQRPVGRVSWPEAQTFCRKLGAARGLTVRLPTEAEWEYACRAGTTTRFYSGDAESALNEVGWYFKNSDTTTHPVGRKKANAWGLYDMHGNVAEWCLDWGEPYTSSAVTDPQGPDSGNWRVLRGGDYGSNHEYCRSMSRPFLYPDDNRFEFTGFRVVVPKLP